MWIVSETARTGLGVTYRFYGPFKDSASAKRFRKRWIALHNEAVSRDPDRPALQYEVYPLIFVGDKN